MKNMYVEWIEEDIKYIEDLREELVRWEKEYKSRVFDGNWPKEIRAVTHALREDILRNIQILGQNIKNAEEHRRILDETYQGKIAENVRNAPLEGVGTRDPNQESAGAQPEAVGSAPEEDDDHWGENQPR